MPGILSDYLREARSKKVINYLNGKILDVGCGPATNYQIILDRGLSIDSYTGIEFDPQQVSLLKSQFPAANFIAVDLDDEVIPINDKFDTIILLAVIEHIFNLKFLFNQLRELLNEGGKIIITTPTPFGNDFVHRIGTKFGLFNKEGGQDDHITIFNKKRLNILAGEFDLVLIDYRKFQFGCNQFAVMAHKS